MIATTMERPSGPNPAQMGLPGNPAQGRRAAFAAGINIPPPPPIPKTVRKIPSNSGLTASAPIAQSQVIVLARDAMKKAVEENQSQVAEASAVSSELKPGVTVNLSHKNIQKLPEEVVDVIKDQLERYVTPILCRCTCKGRSSRATTDHKTYFCQTRPLPQQNLVFPSPIRRMHVTPILERSQQQD